MQKTRKIFGRKNPKRWIKHPHFGSVITFLLTCTKRRDAKNTGVKRSVAESHVLDKTSAFWLGNQIQSKLTLLHFYLITVYDHKQQD
jgi:hypothetical protein